MNEVQAGAPAENTGIVPPAPPPSPAAQVQQALAQLSHPNNLDLQSRLHAIEQFLRVLGHHLIPMLPTE